MQKVIDDTGVIMQNKRHNFKELIVWKESMSFAQHVLVLVKSFPTTEHYGFVSQMNRSVISIASNIAEGASRKSNKSFVNFLEIALGSCYESETQLILAIHLGYIKEAEGELLLDKVHAIRKMLISLISKFETST